MGEGIYKHLRSNQRLERPAISIADEYLASLRRATAERTRERRDTDGRLTALQKNTVRILEDMVQNLDYEQAYVVKPDGRVSFQSTSRLRDRATIDSDAVKDAIIIHNHPDLGVSVRENINSDANLNPVSILTNPAPSSIAGRVGPTLSPDDVSAAIRGDAQGIRVRTQGGYIYSLERGDKGWGVSGDEFKKAYKRELNRQRKKYRESYLYAQDDISSRTLDRTGDWKRYYDDLQRHSERYNAVVQHNAISAMASKYGFRYTRRKAR